MMWEILYTYIFKIHPQSPSNILTFTLIGEANTAEYFEVDEDNGFVYVKKSLSLISNSIFRVSILIR